jgi:type I restriction-modification system DNA methylase subunit
MKRKNNNPVLAGLDPDASFSDFEQLLMSNSGEDAFDVAIRLLAAKLEDEIQAKTGGCRRFEVLDSAAKTLEVVESLFSRATRRWPSIEFNGGLGITAEQLVRCMRPLCGWDLMATDLSHLDAMLERLVARGSKGALGQYFTPRPIVRMCVEILNPVGPERVIDPACGSAGFLFEAVQHARRNGQDAPRCLGIDLGSRSLKVAALMAMVVGPELVSITRGNSIDGREHANVEVDGWRGFLEPENEATTLLNPKPPRPWGSWHRLQCEVLLTNPPFAGVVDAPEVLSVYQSQSSREAPRKGGVGREYLFLERAVTMLAPGGRLAIVLPQGVLANASCSYIRRWVMNRCKLLGVIGLHPYSFLPNTGVKASVLFLMKDAKRARSNYPVFFAVSRFPGKDSRGKRAGSEDYQDIARGFSAFLATCGFEWATGRQVESGRLSPPNVVMADEVRQDDRLDAEYYDVDIRSTHRELVRGANGQTIGAVVERNIGRFKRSSVQTEIDYVDISAVESRTGAIVPNTIDASNAPSRATSLARPGDVLVSTVRPDRNTVALVSSQTKRPLVASNGFCLLRARHVAPELLYTYCRTEVFRSLLARHATATMYPAVTDRDILDMPLLLPPPDVAGEIVTAIQSGLTKLEEAKNEIRLAIEKMNVYVSSSLAETAHHPSGTPPDDHATHKSRRSRMSKVEKADLEQRGSE